MLAEWAPSVEDLIFGLLIIIPQSFEASRVCYLDDDKDAEKKNL